MTIDRRGFLGAGAAAAAAGLAAGLPDAEAARRRRRKRVRVRKADVVVVGAGFAGLTAALRVMEAGRSVVLVEARDRVGGRVNNHELPGGDISESGGTFVGPTQNHIVALGKQFGVGTFPTYNEGQNVYVNGGERSTFSDTSPTGSAPLDPQIVAELALVVAQLDEMSLSVPVDAPWHAPRAAEWDGQTLESWLRDNSVSERFRRLVPAATRPIFGVEPRDLSLLFVLFYIAASGDERTVGTFERNFNTREGAQMFRMAGGPYAICERIRERLGRRVVLGSPVRRISQTRVGVRVVSDKVTVQARQAIVALPPALAGRIHFSPALPSDRDMLSQRLAQGYLAKVAAVYSEPWWRAKGLTGQALSTDGPVSATFDDSPPDGSPGVIFGFVGGDELRRHQARSAPERRRVVLEQFVGLFGEEAAGPIDYFETIWPEERWSRGGPVGVAGPGTYLAYGPALRRPEGRIHWAGTETSTYWNGYMDGAVRSGERAAREVLDQL
jgi:monoamine oxidase